MLQMLTSIENKTSIENNLEELFEMIEMIPPEKVEQAEKVSCQRLLSCRDRFIVSSVGFMISSYHVII